MQLALRLDASPCLGYDNRTDAPFLVLSCRANALSVNDHLKSSFFELSPVERKGDIIGAEGANHRSIIGKMLYCCGNETSPQPRGRPPSPALCRAELSGALCGLRQL